MYRVVALNDTGKPFQISIKQMSGDLIELGTDPGDTIDDVINFLSWHLGLYQTNRIVLMDENGGSLKPAMTVTQDLELSLYIRTDADMFGELYAITFDIGEAILHLEEEYRHLIEIGRNDDILEDFVDGWMDNILPNVTRLPSDPRLTMLQGIAIRLIEESRLSPEKKESLIIRLMQPPEEDEDLDPDDDPNYDAF